MLYILIPDAGILTVSTGISSPPLVGRIHTWVLIKNSNYPLKLMAETIVTGYQNLTNDCTIVEELSIKIPELSRKAFADACIVTNPRRPSVRDIEVIYEEAL